MLKISLRIQKSDTQLATHYVPLQLIGEPPIACIPLGEFAQKVGWKVRLHTLQKHTSESDAALLAKNLLPIHIMKPTLQRKIQFFKGRMLSFEQQQQQQQQQPTVAAAPAVAPAAAQGGKRALDDNDDHKKKKRQQQSAMARDKGMIVVEVIQAGAGDARRVHLSLMLDANVNGKAVLSQLPSELPCNVLRLGPMPDDLIIGSEQRIIDIVQLEQEDEVYRVFASRMNASG